MRRYRLELPPRAGEGLFAASVVSALTPALLRIPSKNFGLKSTDILFFAIVSPFFPSDGIPRSDATP